MEKMTHVDEFKEITEYLDSTKSEKPTILSEREIKIGIMELKKCKLVEAKVIFKDMIKDGLELFPILSSSSDVFDFTGRSYNITEYGNLREYLS